MNQGFLRRTLPYLAAIAVFSTCLVAGTTSSHATNTRYFGYTGNSVVYTVPAGVSQLKVALRGAAGGGISGGVGAVVTGDLVVDPGEELQINIGGRGTNGAGGWNGGGHPGVLGGLAIGQNYGGGGASDIRRGSCAQTSSCDVSARVAVAGGGGGGDAQTASYGSPVGGSGGTPVASDGGSSYGVGGAGASTAAGLGGDGNDTSQNGFSGSLGIGGNGANEQTQEVCAGAGGGGGWFGGGGGGADTPPCSGGGAGGGGSSYTDTQLVSNEAFTLANDLEDGEVAITAVGDTSTTQLGNTTVHEITGKSANLRVTVPASDESSQLVFQYSKGSLDLGVTQTQPVTIQPSATPTVISQKLFNLDPQARYRIRAVWTSNSIQLRNSITEFDTARPPSRPEPPIATGMTNRGAVKLTWLAPRENGGAAIERYQIVGSVPGTGCSSSASSNTGLIRSCIISGLNPQMPYSFSVEAFNDAGGSGPSNFSAPVIPGARSLPVSVYTPKRDILTQSRTRFRISVAAKATGRVEIGIGKRSVCVARIVNGRGNCAGRVKGLGRYGLRAIFYGTRIDAGASGGTLRPVYLRNVSLRTTLPKIHKCRVSVVVQGKSRARKYNLHISRVRAGTSVPFMRLTMKDRGHFSVRVPIRFGKVRIQAKGKKVSSNIRTLTTARPGRC
ncbi:MAG: fibronectin type III domain-containing protein [Candidatus Nanopelagicales bacterium]